MYFFATFFLHILFLHTVYSCWFAKNIETLACSSRAEVFAEGTDEWDKLYLVNTNSLIHLKNDSFIRSPNLVDLTVANIASIEAGTFKGLNKLDKLRIQRSEIEEIPVGLLNNLPIRSFDVLITKLNRIQPGFFKNVIDFLQVDLQTNNIREIKKGVFDNTSIFKLYLSSNRIDKIEDKSFENMNDLIYLSFRDNLLNSFSTEQYLGISYSLTNLWLNQNKLTKITKDMFTTTPILQQLYLDFNQLESIEPESFHKIPLLQFIDISNNKLRQLNPNMFLPSMKEVNYIAVHNNQLTYINKAFFLRTPILKHITYGGNPLQCPCSRELDKLMAEKNVTRLCDEDYIKGERPSCVIGSAAPEECLYDEDLNNGLYDLFRKEVMQYPELKLKCDTTKGIENAFLNNETSKLI